jgi:hypothetical protein
VRVLFDQGTPVPLRGSLTNHEVSTAHERGWSTLKNGALLDAAEQEAFKVPVTTDSNLKYQQNLNVRRIATVVLTSTSRPRILLAPIKLPRAVLRFVCVESAYAKRLWSMQASGMGAHEFSFYLASQAEQAGEADAPNGVI